MLRTKRQRDIYADVDSAEDIRAINQTIRTRMRRADSLEDLTELKKRSDYLCALSLSPAWQDRFGDEAGYILSIAVNENRTSSELANQMARRHGWQANYDPWGD